MERKTIKDLLNVGDKFNNYTVIDLMKEESRTHVMCRCICGNIRKVSAYKLVDNDVIGCGCHIQRRNEIKRGTRFGFLTTTSDTQYSRETGYTVNAVCDCGKPVLNIRPGKLISGKRTCCGAFCKVAHPEKHAQSKVVAKQNLEGTIIHDHVAVYPTGKYREDDYRKANEIWLWKCTKCGNLREATLPEMEMYTVLICQNCGHADKEKLVKNPTDVGREINGFTLIGYQVSWVDHEREVFAVLKCNDCGCVDRARLNTWKGMKSGQKQSWTCRCKTANERLYVRWAYHFS